MIKRFLKYMLMLAVVVTAFLLTTPAASAIGESDAPITGDTLWTLRQMHLEQLPEEEPWPEDLEMPLDMENVKLTLTLSDGTVVKKNASSNLSIEIYNLLLPYFINNQS